VIDGGLKNKWHMEYVTFGDDKKGKVQGTSVIKVNDFFTLNDVALVDKLRYNLSVFFAPTRYRLVKIVGSCSEVVL
jgi:hypothetical protein